jgi:hypothetical protein
LLRNYASFCSVKRMRLKPKKIDLKEALKKEEKVNEKENP